jgi:putative transposase
MSNDNVIGLHRPELIEDPLTELLRSGAKRLIKQAVEAELADLLASYAGQIDTGGRAAVICPNARC